MANEKIKLSLKRINLDYEVQYSIHVYAVHLIYSAQYHCVGIMCIYDFSNKIWFSKCYSVQCYESFFTKHFKNGSRGEGDGGCFGRHL